MVGHAGGLGYRRTGDRGAILRLALNTSATTDRFLLECLSCVRRYGDYPASCPLPADPAVPDQHVRRPPGLAGGPVGLLGDPHCSRRDQRPQYNVYSTALTSPTVATLTPGAPRRAAADLPLAAQRPAVARVLAARHEGDHQQGAARRRVRAAVAGDNLLSATSSGGPERPGAGLRRIAQPPAVGGLGDDLTPAAAFQAYSDIVDAAVPDVLRRRPSTGAPRSRRPGSAPLTRCWRSRWAAGKPCWWTAHCSDRGQLDPAARQLFIGSAASGSS